MKRLLLFVLSIFGLVAISAQTWNGITGFATYSDLGLNGVTGGGNGQVVHVTTRAQLAQYAGSAAPYVIIIDKDIDGGGMQDMQDELSINSNKTIIGSGAGKALNGVALIASNKQNIIIRNIKLQKGRIDGVAFHNCHHVWIDHCDLSDSYDGLLDITNGSDYFTVSWVKLHHHDKVSITNSGTCHYDDYFKEKVTFAHCMFANNVQRNPRIGYGKMHVYNGYWEQISSYCIGFHSQAQVLSENNHFSATAKTPFCNQYSDKLPYKGYLTDKGSYFANGKPASNVNHAYTDITYTPLDYYFYDFDLDATDDVINNTPKGVGPREGLQYEPILNPGNGAIDIPLSQRLSWGVIDGATSTVMYFGTSADNMQQTTPDAVTLQPATQYYWRVKAVVNGADHWSPVYTFKTAGEKATKPYPANDNKMPWLRYPVSGTEFAGALPISWRPAADAARYKVYISDSEATLDNGLAGETQSLSFIPGNLSTGVKYYWRVDVVKSNGQVVKGDTWTFGTSSKVLVEGKNEAEKMYRSAMAFLETNSSASGGQYIVGDQGPGAIMAKWDGPEGRYAFETAVLNEASGPNYVGIAVNNKRIDAWLTTDEASGIGIRKTRNTVMLKKGDDVRIDFVAGLVDGKTYTSRCRIDYVNIIPATTETIDVPRKSGVFHEPVSTPGYDCEYLPVRNVIFKDSLATVGAKDETQVKDKYCAWISRNEGRYTVYLKATAIAKFIYRNSNGKEKEVSHELDKTINNTLTADETTADGTLYALKLYKKTPATTVYYKPAAETGKDHQLVWTPDLVFKDVSGTKGDKGKYQMRDEYETWIKYYNPTANEVTAKENVNAFIDPVTDTSKTILPKGKNGTTVVFTAEYNKSITYYLRECSRMKIYFTGTGGNSTTLTMAVVNMDTEEVVNIVSEPAPGKNVASNVVETELNPNCRYAIRLTGTEGPMLVYAVKMWPGEATGIEGIASDKDANTDNETFYNIAGQRIAKTSKQVLISNGQKMILK